MIEEIHLGPAIQGSAKADNNAESASFDLELLGVPSEAWRTAFNARLVDQVRVSFERRAPGRPAMLLRVICNAPGEVQQILSLVSRAVAETNSELVQRDEKRTRERDVQTAKRSELERAVNEALTKVV
jgi:hypothetical protein